MLEQVTSLGICDILSYFIRKLHIIAGIEIFDLSQNFTQFSYLRAFQFKS